MLYDALLGNIKSPEDLRGLNSAELGRLAAEIRELIISTVSKNGGHLASNLGVVELTIALHRELNSPDDMIVWDVGHQCYAHKIITGRYKSFSTLRSEGGIAGFPKRTESPHDWFNTGHASTSISAALGLLAAANLETAFVGERKSCAVAVIGDGALTGGLAYEALSHAGQLGLPLVVILNDNKMSISPNVGGLSKYLSRLSMKSKYQLFRRTFDMLVKKIPLIGDLVFDAIVRLKRAVKAVFYTDNFFVDLGFEYVGPIDGHDLPLLCGVIRDVKKLGKPVVVHVITQKGKGYGRAEEEPSAYHGVSSAAAQPNGAKAAAFTAVFGAALCKAAERDNRVAAITAAMEMGTGLSAFRQRFPERFFDVGIAEEHAVTFAAGLAVKGFRPVVALYSTFIQRAVDQVIHDVCLQNLPVVFALDRAGFVSDDGETHQGLYDISLFRSAPNMTMLAPAGRAELESMLEWALSADNTGPVTIRYPKDYAPADDPAFSLPLKKGRGVFVRRSAHGNAAREKNAPLCIAFTGSLYPYVLDAAELLMEQGFDADLYNLRFIAPVDEDYFARIMDSYEFVLVVEEGVKAGGFGEYTAELAWRKNCTCRIMTMAVTRTLDALGKRGELLARNSFDGEGIAAAAVELLLASTRYAEVYAEL